MSSPLRNATILSTTTSISLQEEEIESGNEALTRRPVEVADLGSMMRKTFGWLRYSDQIMAAIPNGVLRRKRND